MFQKIKNALLICLTLIIMISATNTFAQLQDDNGNVGPLRSQKTEPINPLALQTPTPNNTQNTYSIGGNSTFLDAWNEQIAAEKVAQKEAEAARKKEAAARREERAARINENKIKQQKYEEEVNKTATEAANNFNAQYIEDFGTKQKELEKEEEQLGKELNNRYKEDLKNFGKMNDKEIELKEKGIDPNTDPEYQKLKQNYLDGKQKTEEIEKQIDVLWESQNKLQKKEKESRNSLNFFNNAQNIGNLELMQAANGRVTYQGCTFLGNFDPNSALGSGNNRILQSAICWMQDVSASLGVGMALGATLIKANTDGFWDGFMTIIIGVCMFLAFFLIYLMFPLKLLDAFIRLAFVFALMPLWIILWVFPATAGYTKKAWDTFIGTLFYFISLSIVIALVLILMNESIQPEGTRTEIFKLMLGDNTAEAAKLLSFGKTFFLTLAFGLMSYTLLNTAEALSNMFASAPSLGLDKAMTGNATQAYQATKSVAGTAKRAVTGGAALVGAGIGYARGTFSKKDTPQKSYLERCDDGIKSAENIRSYTENDGADRDQNRKNRLNEFFKNQEQQGISYSKEEKQILSDLANNKINPVEARDRFIGWNGKRFNSCLDTAENINDASKRKIFKGRFRHKELEKFFKRSEMYGIHYTEDEKEVLYELANGKTNRENAEKRLSRLTGEEDSDRKPK